MQRFLQLVFWCALFVICAQTGFAQFYQGTNMEFGKNRIQYREFTWYYYPSKNFDVYYYNGGEAMAQYTFFNAESDLADLQKFFDYSLDERIQILTFINQGEFKQSNLGLLSAEQQNVGGTATILGNKMFVYYQDSYATLHKQIRENIAQVLFSQLMYGGSWKDVLKNATMLSVPEWYEKGIVSYASNGMDTRTDTRVRDLMQNSRFKSLNFYEGDDAREVGKCFWHFISEVYGGNVIPNILYMAQASKSIEGGFMYVLGLNLEQLSMEFRKFYLDRASAFRNEVIPGVEPMPYNVSDSAFKAWRMQQTLMGDVEVKYKKRYHYSHFTLSPDQKHVAYVTHEMGQFRIWLYSIETKTTECILKRDYLMDRPADETYPVLAWHPSSEILTYTYEERANVWMGNYQLTEQEHTLRELHHLDKILDMEYSPDGKRLIMSAVRIGQTDLYLFQTLGSNQEQLTFDPWDDMHPTFIDGGERILFSSNRTDDTLRTDLDMAPMRAEKDVYIFDLNKRSKYLKRITDTPADEDYPEEFAKNQFTFLSNETGVYNQAIAVVDSAISTIDTTIHYRYFTRITPISSYHRDVLESEYDPQSNTWLQVFERNNQPHVFISSMHQVTREQSLERVLDSIPAKIQGASLQEYAIKKREGEVNIRQYVFEDEEKNYTYEKEIARIQPAQETTTADTALALSRPLTYRLNFAADRVVAQLSNNFFNPVYQNYTGSSPSSISPGLSGTTQFGITDLFEDYRIVGGVRTNFGIDNSEYGVSFERLRDRWDRKIVFSRQSQRIQQGFSVYKLISNDIAYTVKYPFSEVFSFRLRGDYRLDRLITQSNDLQTLDAGNQTEVNLSVKSELVFDNTMSLGLNLYRGTRWKVWAERYQKADIQNLTDLNVVGFDFRHYQKIHRSLIAAIRFAGVTSFGDYKIINYFGGVDNWIFQRVDNSTPISTSEPYRFQSFVGPMRGFYVNARNGNTAAVINAEVRWPVFRYLMKTPIKSDFLQTFQLVGFCDVGSAWTGWNPYNNQNLFNQTIVTQNPITVTISNNREPIVAGYGFGMHARLLGYFVRADWAWGVDDGRVLPRVFHLSLNLDF
jgi:hypothetical protein